MNIESAPHEKTVFVIGAPRSGTTWLGKIFDSHPMVLYRHEPDTLIPNDHIPHVVPQEQISEQLAPARDLLDAMVAGRFLKSSGTLPIFRKTYRAAPVNLTYSAMIMALRIAQKVGGDMRRMRRILAPDMADPLLASDITVVMKSIISRGRTGLLAAARPDMRILFILRDPFGQVASMLRGISLGKFDAELPLADCLQTPQAATYGLTPAVFDRLHIVEQYAWYWALLNEMALDDLKSHPRKMVMRYRDLVADPFGVTRQLFGFANLGWQSQTERFLKASTTSNLPDSYYQVYKNSLDSLNKWRRQLPIEHQQRIAGTVRDTAIWRMYPEFHDLAP